jgi:DNA-binding CsgD family transcriptional regulator
MSEAAIERFRTAWVCTPQELEVLRLLSEGKTARQVTRDLGHVLTIREVEHLITKLVDRTRSVNRVNLVATAIRQNVIR